MDHDRRLMKKTLAMTCTRPDAEISQVQRDTLVNAPLPSCTLVQGRLLRALPWTVFDDDDRASLVDAHRQDEAARKLEATASGCMMSARLKRRTFRRCLPTAAQQVAIHVEEGLLN